MADQRHNNVCGASCTCLYIEGVSHIKGANSAPIAVLSGPTLLHTDNMETNLVEENKVDL